jgi:hypothetical protein
MVTYCPYSLPVRTYNTSARTNVFFTRMCSNGFMCSGEMDESNKVALWKGLQARAAVRKASSAPLPSAVAQMLISKRKWREVRASNHNFKIFYYHNKSTNHKLGETNNKLNTQ